GRTEAAGGAARPVPAAVRGSVDVHAPPRARRAFRDAARARDGLREGGVTEDLELVAQRRALRARAVVHAQVRVRRVHLRPIGGGGRGGARRPNPGVPPPPRPGGPPPPPPPRT